MNNSRRQSSPLGPKIVRPTPYYPRAIARTEPFKPSIAPSRAPIYPRATAPFKPYKPNIVASRPPIHPRAMTQNKPTKATTPPPEPVAPRAMAQAKPSRAVTPTTSHVASQGAARIKPSKRNPPQLDGSMFLAGYLAHEYIKKGTLFGKKYEPTQANAPPTFSSASSTDFRAIKKPNHGYVDKGKGKAIELGPKPNQKLRKFEPQADKDMTYAEVSAMLKMGMHIPGIVNPSQLASFLASQSTE